MKILVTLNREEKSELKNQLLKIMLIFSRRLLSIYMRCFIIKEIKDIKQANKNAEHKLFCCFHLSPSKKKNREAKKLYVNSIRLRKRLFPPNSLRRGRDFSLGVNSHNWGGCHLKMILRLFLSRRLQLSLFLNRSISLSLADLKTVSHFGSTTVRICYRVICATR